MTVHARPRQATPLSKFSRRSLASSVVLGDYLYIEGGEYSTVDTPEATPLKTTLSIPLHKSWTNSTVDIRSIGHHQAPRLDVPTLWPDHKTNSFYQWGGYNFLSDGDVKPPNAFWRFKADGSGGGKWSRLEGPSSSFKRTSFNLMTVGNRIGYAIGGIPTTAGNPASNPNIRPINEMLMYNIGTGKWIQGDAKGPVRAAEGVTQFADSFGARGLLLTLGGVIMENGRHLNPFDHVSIYDPDQQSWFSQATTGEVPAPRERACSVGIEGPDGAYQIYMYGGYNQFSEKAFDDLYILSLPGFIWRKAGQGLGGPLASQTCQVVGQRQMIVVGGTNMALVFPKNYADEDPMTQGLSIFDLTDLEWKDGYDANAAEYDTPEVIKHFYANNNLSSVSWSSDAVQSLFQGSQPSSSPSPPSPPSSTSSNPSPSSSSASAGAIAGGVVGSIVFVVLVIAVIIFLVRRRRKEPQRSQPGELSGAETAQLESDMNARNELGTESGINEIAPGRELYKPVQTPLEEIDGYELGHGNTYTAHSTPPAELGTSTPESEK